MEDVRPYGRMDLKGEPDSDLPADWQLRPPRGDRDTCREMLLHLLRRAYELHHAERESPWPVYRRWSETLDGLAAEIEQWRGTPTDAFNILQERYRRGLEEEETVEPIEKMMSRLASSVQSLRALAQDFSDLGGDPHNRDRKFEPLREVELHLVEGVEMATGSPHFREVTVLLVATEMLAAGQTADTHPDRLSDEGIYFRRKALEQKRRRARD